MIMSTTNDVPGRGIEIITLVVACIPYFGSKYAEAISDVGGRTRPSQTTSDVPATLEKRRTEVLDRLMATAELVHADAVVAIRMDTREITATWKELCAYGTAVRFTR